MALTLGTPLAEALSNQIQPKLVDIGWSVGGEDSSPLSEYICLMLVNGKSQEQIAQELSGDLLGLPPGDNSATDFARWLFAKVDELSKTVGSDSQQPVQPPQQVQHQQQQHQQHHPQQHLQHHSHDLPQEHQSEQVDMQNGNGGIEDEAMQDGGTMERDLVPSAPKAMRQPNSSRLMNQLSKAMERQPNEQSLHRVRQQPSERIDKFKARDPPRGPASNRPNYRNGRPPFGQNGRGRAGPTFQPAIPPSVFANMNPQQQMAFFQMYQQQSQMMGPYMPPGGRGFGPPIGPNGQPMLMGGEDAYGNNFVVPLRAPPGPSLFERIENPPDMQSQNRFDNNHNGFRNNHNGTNNSEQDAVDETMEEGTGDESSGKPEETPCLYGTHCTKADCIYGHPPPAAAAFGGPKRTYISGEKCPFGAGCKNRKCTGSHPSPASAKTTGGKLGAAKIDQDCKFFPNCTNPSCPFKHPSMPPCRFGTNCTRPDCHFTHGGSISEVPCKFHPCLNPNCIYRHEEGQQQEAAAPGPGGIQNKVWVNKGKHVSDRRFVTGDGEDEELIIPGGSGGSSSNVVDVPSTVTAVKTEDSGDMDTAPVDEVL